MNGNHHDCTNDCFDISHVLLFTIEVWFVLFTIEHEITLKKPRFLEFKQSFHDRGCSKDCSNVLITSLAIMVAKMRKHLTLFGLAGVCGFLTLLQMNLLSKIGSGTPMVLPRDEVGARRRHAQWIRLLQRRRDKSAWSNTNDGAFIQLVRLTRSSDRRFL
jgi:hypothetical protein